jgi:nucleoside-diphosphate-sugar epimerase
MKIIITGATSFIGERFVKVAVTKEWEVIAVIRKESNKKEHLKLLGVAEIIELNMDEYEHIGDLAGTCDCFIHFAWDGTRGAERANKELQYANYCNSVHAVESVIRAGCKRIITAGSQAEYGFCNGVIEETLQCDPNTQYGIYKFKLYETVKQLCTNNGIAYKEPRFFSLYGPGDYPKTLIMSMIENMRNDRPCELTQCVQKWDFLYIDDAIEAVVGLCEKECPDGAYNLGSGDVRELKDYVEELKCILHSDSVLHYGSIPYPETGMVSICPSIEKIRRELDWRANTSFCDGIRHCLE